MPNPTIDPVFNWFATHRELTPPVADEIALCFDWIPAVTNGCVTFKASIVRGEARSELQFDLNLHRLDNDELEQLHSVLSKRHSGIGDGVEVTKAVAWLLGVSLKQNSGLDGHERHAAVRRLLLVKAED